MTDTEIMVWKERINHMSQMDMARLWRFAPSGHPVFDTSLSLYAHFKARFDAHGGFTPAVSKAVGW